ncbi:MAG TPA: hypothetical protein VKR06_44230 [Ktedonosporobacter sp.]|nr:hypothetical protein [Ktedonosporobacter sp.]
MKMNGQTRSFVKQVQVDLLALSDAHLFRTIQQWIDGSSISEDAYIALGYTRVLVEAKPLPHSHTDMSMSDTETRESVQWHAPSPPQLRALLTTMDANAFAQHVITSAFNSLHTTYPEWYEGVTFNAHLANYLRRMREK